MWFCWVDDPGLDSPESEVHRGRVDLVVGDLLVEGRQIFMAFHLEPLNRVFVDVPGSRELAEQTDTGAFLVFDANMMCETGGFCLLAHLNHD